MPKGEGKEVIWRRTPDPLLFIVSQLSSPKMSYFKTVCPLHRLPDASGALRPLHGDRKCPYSYSLGTAQMRTRGRSSALFLYW